MRIIDISNHFVIYQSPFRTILHYADFRCERVEYRSWSSWYVGLSFEQESLTNLSGVFMIGFAIISVKIKAEWYLGEARMLD